MLTLPAHIERIFSQNDKSWNAKISFGELSTEQIAELSKANGRLVMLAITLSDEFTDKEKEALESARIYATDVAESTQIDNLSDKKQAFILAFEKHLGRITDACKAIGIHRTTYYLWRENDAEFVKAVDSIDVKALWAEKAERAIDKLLEKDDPNPSAAIFTAKVQAGWQEPVQKIEQKTVQEPITIKIVE